MTPEEKFAEYDEANPKIYALFVRFAREAKAAGLERYSSDAILHRIRWFVRIETQDPEGFKVNDNYSSHYSRKLIAEFPEEFGDFFELRVTRTERELARCHAEGRLF